MLTRRDFMASAAAGAAAGTGLFAGAVWGGEKTTTFTRPIVGTIRWDAFYGTGTVPRAVEGSLGPARYHKRAPFFAKVTGKDALSINGDAPGIMAQEIAYAAQACVYWAFLTYPWNSDLTRPLRMFLDHPDREKVRFTFILNRCLFDEKEWVKKSERMLSSYAESPTAGELAAHVRTGMDFVYRNPKTCPTRSLMMYAWNEHDEGGWLCPTLDPTTGKPDDSRARAVGEAIRSWRPPAGSGGMP